MSTCLNSKWISLLFLSVITQLSVFSQSEPAEMRGIVDRHNFWRNQVGSAPIKWSPTVAASAQRYANTLKTKACEMTHSQDNPYGENLFMSMGSTFTPAQVTDDWADEKSHYNLKTMYCDLGQDMCGHYTQIIWSTTTEIGCAKVSCGSKELWVCQYNPPGNYTGVSPVQNANTSGGNSGNTGNNDNSGNTGGLGGKTTGGKTNPPLKESSRRKENTSSNSSNPNDPAKYTNSELYKYVTKNSFKAEVPTLGVATLSFSTTEEAQASGITIDKSFPFYSTVFIESKNEKYYSGHYGIKDGVISILGFDEFVNDNFVERFKATELQILNCGNLNGDLISPSGNVTNILFVKK